MVNYCVTKITLTRENTHKSQNKPPCTTLNSRRDPGDSTTFPHTSSLHLKPQPNDRNMQTQHIATLLGATCCARLTALLRYVGCCWLKFEHGQIWANNTQHVATRRNRVAKRAQQCCDMLRLHVAIVWLGLKSSVRVNSASSSKPCREISPHPLPAAMNMKWILV